ncbi:bifunctional adenosylcobinamide kinase/adenosylcobinamide-phosphate guanylyltransferase [Piscinibacter koreensis]|uniref:Bifunctional adenosylcobalamin biosynthesis protein n=1 Tax=Piscinibacter koreensis TaxID=2742824 RepID=A0A7Y6NP44_9BURK|nr:bifunctional adenosylcobinamide kinase/adenosylcobinamide-phosphate guanylyltransferase [Schlegelella koreensis]NUZ06773.1 bifunctional adenosylcobinamide kinase/adenosylcobinamide-phosphate guanylyltransferase [Schlegelella koreensis]
MSAVTHELLLGGARSGKSRTAESRAGGWLASDPTHRATLVATALAGDPEMAARIAWHRADRGARVPALETVEAPQALGATLRRLAHPRRLLVVDCLTLWLTQCLLPPAGAPPGRPWAQEKEELLAALRHGASPVVLVSNEIGLGVVPLSREARACVDALGELHQAVAALCGRVTLMVAGCELRVKDLA